MTDTNFAPAYAASLDALAAKFGGYARAAQELFTADRETGVRDNARRGLDLLARADEVRTLRDYRDPNAAALFALA